ncbi:MAG TPA: MlaD family protein [Solirubrobacteraceae bacterium]
MKRILLSAAIVIAAGAFIVLATGASNKSANGTYKIELDNAFGLVTGADLKVSGVPAGTISAIDLNQKDLHAVVTVSISKGGFGQFHQDATCESRPQSLIGEYFIDCNPGSSGPVMKPGSTIPVTHTQSTIAADLVQNVMRLPYRERLTLIINELGAAAAARSGDLQAALQRAVPALTETDNLLNLLGNDSTTLQNLTRDSNSVITALADNSRNVERFIVEANRTAGATAVQDNNLRQTFANLPATLEQLRPAMAKLSRTATTNTPVLQNLNASAVQLNRFFTDLPAFSRSSQPAIKSLGQASVTGRQAVIAARPTITDLNRFAQPTPELAGNLNIVLHDLDTQSRAVEPDPRSPGGKGFSGLQALLGYVFNTALAINTYGPYGHVLAVDAFYSKMCSPYQSPASLAMYLKEYGPAMRQCYAFLGPNQPGVTTTDPSNPGAPVPDPGGAPPGQRGAATSAARLTAAMVMAGRQANSKSGAAPASSSGSSAGSSLPLTAGSNSATIPSAPSAPSAPGTPTTSTGSGAPSIGQIISGAGMVHTKTTNLSGGSTSSPSPSQAQALLNYLLAP